MSEEIKIPLEYSQVSIMTAGSAFLSSYMDVQRVHLQADICQRVFEALSEGAEMFITIRPGTSGQGENNSNADMTLKI